jgi:hypothetical protein
MERRDVVLAHWLEFQNGDDPNAHIRSFERAWHHEKSGFGLKRLQTYC